MLLPRRTFVRALREAMLDVPALHRAWPWASCELIALRAADLIPGLFAAKWRDGAVEWRSQRTRDKVTLAERVAVAHAIWRRQASEIADGWAALAWSLDETNGAHWALSVAVEVAR